ncbi:MAG TPA: endo-1,4-beta-xylanase [Steroidobacteraceae bacterium]
MTTIYRLRTRLLAAALSFTALIFLPPQAPAQIATGQSKFLGSTTTGASQATFSKYWNQITPENEAKWGSVQGSSQTTFNWAPLDAIYNFAQTNGYKFKFHNLVWGAQQPSFLGSLTQAQQLAAVQTWINAAGARYPKSWAVDVVNEPLHTPPSYIAALGGAGTTGWDWVINTFQMARKAFPNSQLLINEFGTENDANARSQYLQIIALLKARGLIDGIGVQAHFFNLDSMNAAQMKTALDSYQTAGLPVYLSELDITGGGTDAGQLAQFQALFPVMWQHPVVQGITTWGFVVGQTWATGTGLLNADGTERPALTFIKNFVTGGTTPPPPPPPPPPTGSCKVTYAITNQWNTGFTAGVTITNTSSAAISGWTLAWSFANGQTVTQLWNGSETQSGANVTVTNLNYNANIPAGGSYNGVGFQGTWSGTNSLPTAFTLNGTACN